MKKFENTHVTAISAVMIGLGAYGQAGDEIEEMLLIDNASLNDLWKYCYQNLPEKFHTRSSLKIINNFVRKIYESESSAITFACLINTIYRAIEHSKHPSVMSHVTRMESKVKACCPELLNSTPVSASSRMDQLFQSNVPCAV